MAEDIPCGLFLLSIRLLRRAAPPTASQPDEEDNDRLFRFPPTVGWRDRDQQVGCSFIVGLALGRSVCFESSQIPSTLLGRPFVLSAGLAKFFAKAVSATTACRFGGFGLGTERSGLGIERTRSCHDARTAFAVEAANRATR